MCGPVAEFFDRRKRGSRRLQEVDPFCMASVMEDSSLGYLSKNCFMLRLELRIRSSSNESVAFAIHEKTVFCEVSLEKRLPFVKRGRCQWNIKHAWEMSPSILRTDHFKIAGRDM